MQSQRAIGSKELQSVLALPGPKRYAHTVKQIADWQQVWGLHSPGGWASAADESGNPAFAIWPHAEYAKACVAGEWADSEPNAIEVHEFLSRILSPLVEQRAMVAVFPIPIGSVVLVTAAQFELDIRSELERVE
jgi:hypothetical protein